MLDPEKHRSVWWLLASLALSAWTTAAAGAQADDPPAEKVLIGKLAGGPRAWAVGDRAVKDRKGRWGITVEGAGMASSSQPAPVAIEFWHEGVVTESAWPYRSVDPVPGGLVGSVRIELPGKHVALVVEDRWTVAEDQLQLARGLTVEGTHPSGFLSAFMFRTARGATWRDAQWFVPGTIYGRFEHLSDRAIGGRAGYVPGAYEVRIREDRLPAPLVGGRFADGTFLAVLDPSPDGRTTREDSRDVEAVPLTDKRFRFGAVGAGERSDGLFLGYWFPGTEGSVTYQGNTYPGGQLQKYRRRYHPLEDRLVHRYQIAFRFGRSAHFPQFMKTAWRWAWDALEPKVTGHDLAVVRRVLTDMLADRVVEQENRAGIPNFIDASAVENPLTDTKAILGFCGKNLEAAQLLLLEAQSEEAQLEETQPEETQPDNTVRGKRLRRLAGAIIESFLKLEVAPPAGEGFQLAGGETACALEDGQVYLRSYGDGVKALLKAYLQEKKAGRAHPEIVAWCRRFADWLLTQQQPEGGFPRVWKAGDGRVASASPNSSFSAIPLLVLLSQATGDRHYLDAAVRAADYCWDHGQSRGQFVGGTIDNPDVLDKEAATLSLEAYRLLAEATGDSVWLERARAAADYAETWIYCWNVPMPGDEPDAQLPWKRTRSTVGLQLISTGHSLVDAYMAFDADEYGWLYQQTGDRHYLEVARILLHNTKGMLAIPGRTYDLAGPGWQQEHWSLAPIRGFGLHRGWLPWVATSQLNGIFGALELEPETREQLGLPAVSAENP